MAEKTLQTSATAGDGKATADDSGKPAIPEQTPAQSALADWIDKRFTTLARGRWAEEREWYQAGMFDQLKQWLEKDGKDGKRLKPIDSKGKKWPMPVTNHFSKTIATNANALGAAVPEMLAMADNYDAKNRRAAEAAENGIDAANKESGLNVLNAKLARQTVLWGLGITKDSVAFDHSTDEVPDIQEQPPVAGPDGQMVEQGPQVVGMENVPSPRIKSELPTVFEVYLPRDCQSPNLSPLVLERVSMSIGLAKETYPVYADWFAEGETENDGTNSTSGDSLASYFHNALRSLAYSSQDIEMEGKCQFKEVWLDWNELAGDVQTAIEKEWESEPASLYPKMSKLQAAVEFGLFCVTWDKKVVSWGENPWDGDKPYTFFLWQEDVASAYPKGLSVELVPLQKQLNRIDSLMERALMSNAVVKMLWPTTQSTPAPSGDPIEITYWDPIGDGKVKPEYFGGKAYGSELMAKRAQIVADFEALGFTNGVSEGDMPGGGTAFRALAFASAKTEESRKTQRYLWEQAHELRARKLVKMARKVWSEPRKVQTAGFNNRYGAQLLEAADLEGDYELEVLPDSSRPKTLTEKMEVFQTLQEAGMVDPNDPANRAYITDSLGVQDLDLVDNLQYAKAERDLELCKQGEKPQINPFSKWPLHFSVFSNYTLTEEYEGLPPQIQAGILAYTQWMQELINPPTVAPGAAPPPGSPPTGTPPHASVPKPGANMPPPKKQQAKGGIGGPSASHVMGQTPGIQVSTPQVQQAAETEGYAALPNAAGAN
jgi:hypothetical protein